MKHYTLFFLSLFFILMNCQKKEENKTVVNENNIKANSNVKSEIPINLDETGSIQAQPFTKDFLKIEDVKINSQKVMLSQNEFDQIYPKKDSVKTDVWECGSPFEWLDEDWMIKAYGKQNADSGTFERFDGKIASIYTNNAEFNSNKHIVLFNTAEADKNNFQITSNNILLNQNTTIEAFQKLFPKLKKEMTDHKNEFRFRIPVDSEGDDAFLFYFKNRKLNQFTLWWLLC